MTFEEKKTEAIRRMEKLKLNPDIISEFSNENIIKVTDMKGNISNIDDENLKYVKAFEQRYGTLVYHVMHSDTEFGELLTMMYVSDHSEEWTYDYNMLDDKIAYAYVENLSEELFSEIGSVGFISINGGLVRTA